MINIILSPSQQNWNKCAEGDSEQDHCHLLGQAIHDLLKEYECNTCLIPRITGTESFALSEAVRLSNDFVSRNKADKSYHLCIHTDGGYQGNGTSGFYISEAGKTFIIQIWRDVCKLTPWGDGLVNQRRLYELTNTGAIAGLLEISFHDNKEQAKWIHLNINNIAQTIVNSIAAYTGIKKNENISREPDEVVKDNVDIVIKALGLTSSDYWLYNKDPYVRVLINRMADFIRAQGGV